MIIYTETSHKVNLKSKLEKTNLGKMLIVEGCPHYKTWDEIRGLIIKSGFMVKHIKGELNKMEGNIRHCKFFMAVSIADVLGVMRDFGVGGNSVTITHVQLVSDNNWGDLGERCQAVETLFEH